MTKKGGNMKIEAGISVDARFYWPLDLSTNKMVEDCQMADEELEQVRIFVRDDDGLFKVNEGEVSTVLKHCRVKLLDIRIPSDHNRIEMAMAGIGRIH